MKALGFTCVLSISMPDKQSWSEPRRSFFCKTGVQVADMSAASPVAIAGRCRLGERAVEALTGHRVKLANLNAKTECMSRI